MTPKINFWTFTSIKKTYEDFEEWISKLDWRKTISNYQTNYLLWDCIFLTVHTKCQIKIESFSSKEKDFYVSS